MVAPTLSDWQMQYGDGGQLLNGPESATFVDITTIEGIDNPDYREHEVDRDGTHGSHIHAAYFKKRTVVIGIDIYTNTESYVDLVKLDFIPDGQDDWLYWKPPGVSRRQLKCKPVGFKFTTDKLRATSGKISGQIILDAEDPRWYGDETTSSTSYPLTTQTGRIYPKTYPFTYGSSQVGGVFALTNSGNMDTWPVYTLTGQQDHPVITNATTAETSYLDVALGSTDTLVVDTFNRYITLNNINRTDVFRAGGKWTRLAPGINNVTVSANSSLPAAQVAVSFRSAWS